jgi:hypothetical protein
MPPTDAAFSQLASSQFDPVLLNEFALMCFMGNLESVKKVMLPVFS